MAEKARQGIGAGLAQIRHEQDGGEQHAEGPAKPDGERVEAEKENGARVGEKAHAADRDSRQREAVEHRRHAPARDEIILDLEGARADSDQEIKRKRHQHHALSEQQPAPAQLLEHRQDDDQRDEGAGDDAVIGAKMRVWRAQARRDHPSPSRSLRARSMRSWMRMNQNATATMKMSSPCARR